MFLKRAFALGVATCIVWGASAQGDPIDPKELDSPPQLIWAEPPKYPFSMRELNFEGQVLLEYVVDPNGRATATRVVQSSNPAFDRPAINALRSWRFKPGRKNGRPVNALVQQMIIFSLSDGDGRGFWGVSKTADHDQLPPEFRWAKAPQPSFTAYPVYPFEALRTGRKGRAQVSFVIGKNGEIAASQIHEASDEEMGRAVVAALESWTFAPAKAADGSASMAIVHIAFDFDPGGLATVPVMGGTKAVLKLLRERPEKIVPLAQLDRAPRAKLQHAPVYPTALRNSAQEGEALIEFLIDDDGDAQLPRIVSATAPEFGYAAAQAVAAWRFEPPKRKGKAVVARVQVPLNFKLEEKR